MTRVEFGHWIMAENFGFLASVGVIAFVLAYQFVDRLNRK